MHAALLSKKETSWSKKREGAGNQDLFSSTKGLRPDSKNAAPPNAEILEALEPLYSTVAEHEVMVTFVTFIDNLELM